jgi:hypothetical protein
MCVESRWLRWTAGEIMDSSASLSPSEHEMFGVAVTLQTCMVRISVMLPSASTKVFVVFLD